MYVLYVFDIRGAAKLSIGIKKTAKLLIDVTFIEYHRIRLQRNSETSLNNSEEKDNSLASACTADLRGQARGKIFLPDSSLLFPSHANRHHVRGLCLTST
jgi:hypothetical protein